MSCCCKDGCCKDGCCKSDCCECKCNCCKDGCCNCGCCECLKPSNCKKHCLCQWCSGCCCCLCDEEPSEREKLYGPRAKRQCRDLPCLALFLVFWAGMIVVGILSFVQGDLDRLWYGTDMYGDMCGSGDHSSEPVLYWPNPLDLSVQVCLEECPTSTYDLSLIIDLFNPFGDPTVALDAMNCMYNITTPTVDDVYNNLCWPPYQAYPLFGRCVPELINTTELNALFDYFYYKLFNDTFFLYNFVDFEYVTAQLMFVLNARTMLTEMATEVAASWREILIFGLGSFVVAFIWLFVMRLLVGVIVWIMIWLTELGLIGFTVFLYYAEKMKEKELNPDPALRLQSDVMLVQALGYAVNAMIIVATIVFMMILFLRTRIKLAIAIIKEASRALSSMPSIFFFPLFMLGLYGAFLAYWVVVAVFLGTVAVAEDMNYVMWSSMEIYGYTTPAIELQYCILIHAIGFIWTTEFLSAFSEVCIAGSVASWYWVKDKSNVPSCPVWRSVWYAVRYHFGSIAFGSLLITLIRLWRYFLEYLDKKAKKTGPARCILRCCICILKCIACCWEKMIRYWNTQAWVMIAITGQSFCAAGRHAMYLLISSPIRTTVLAAVSGFVLLLTRLCVASLAALGACIWFYFTDDLHFWFAPGVCVFMIGWVIASIFTSIYDMGIHTVLLSFCEDDSRPGDCYDVKLKEFMSNKKKKQIKKAESEAEKEQEAEENKEHEKDKEHDHDHDHDKDKDKEHDKSKDEGSSSHHDHDHDSGNDSD